MAARLFAIILPESSAQDAAVRADALRAELKKLRLQYKKQNLAALSLSAGVAAFPEHAASASVVGARDSVPHFAVCPRRITLAQQTLACFVQVERSVTREEARESFHNSRSTRTGPTNADRC
jgi:hypothetical protein